MHGMPQKTSKLGGFHTHVSRILLSCPSWEQLCQNEAADQKEAKSLSHPGTYRHKGGISVGQLLWTTCKPSDSLVIYLTPAYALRRQPHALDHFAPWSVHMIPQPPTPVQSLADHDTNSSSARSELLHRQQARLELRRAAGITFRTAPWQIDPGP